MPSPLIEQLTREHGYPTLGADDAEKLLSQPGNLVLFFTEDPKRYPEANDVAVVLPELVTAFPGRFRVAVVGPAGPTTSSPTASTGPT